MKALVQRVLRARVTVEGRVRGEIGPGLLVLLGAGLEDGEEQAAWRARRLSTLRIFGDAAGQMNLDLHQADGAVLVVPQFTLYGDARHGRRPDFTGAARPGEAEPLFERFCALLASHDILVQRGVFGAHMQVELVNDGPVTLMLETPSAKPAAQEEG